jgi:tetraacyldisaccharide 4'-kinase
MIGILRLLLFPFALIYDLITRLRNHLFNTGYRHSFEFDRTIISVGNLNVGGTGKTPMIEYLIRLLVNQNKLATLSRGYRRKTRGFHIAGKQDSAQSIGDEPYQYFRKHGEKIVVAVGEDRALAIPEIILEKPEIEIILLDDAYQHRTVVPTLNILLTEYEVPFFKDHILPVGNLRESRQCARRADIVVVTKCSPSISSLEKEHYKRAIDKYSLNKPVFFSSVKYGMPLPIGDFKWKEPVEIVLVSGIGNGSIFKSHMSSKFKVAHHFDFADHHSYSEEEVDKINSLCQSRAQNTSVITTEKDMVKLLPFKNKLAPVGWFYIPIETIIENGAEFDRLVLAAIKS